MSVDSAHAIAAGEAWFRKHGLPYFVESERQSAQRGLGRGRLGAVLATAVLVGVVSGAALGWWTGGVSNGAGTGFGAAGLVLAVYTLTALRLWPIATWAVARTLRSLGLLFPLVTRALPLLLLFITFLFINAEVWQVASSLDGGVLWLTVMLFAAVAVGFLLVRLPEELDRVDQEMQGARLLESVRGTPLEAAARSLAGAHGSVPLVEEEKHVAGFQRANLVLVLLVAQVVQVFLLALAVLFFFLVFGVVAMSPEVIASWIGEQPRAFEWWPTLSLELVQVSIFLAAFSGLYFTVYAVTDESYREQFFTAVTDELERAVGVRAVYRLLKRRAEDAR
jgi:hypothetical protein